MVTAVKDSDGVETAVLGEVRHTISESELLRLLLEIHNFLVCTVDIGVLLSAVSRQLRRFTGHRYSRILLYDPLSGHLSIRALDFPCSKGFIRAGLLIPLQSTAEGWVYTRRKPLIIDGLDALSFPAEITHQLLAEGIRSMCLTPLMSRDRVLGVLSISSPQEGHFARPDLHLLSEVAKPVSIAIENMLNFERISDLNERLTKEKLYLDEQTSSSTCCQQIIGKSPAILSVLKQLNSVAGFDSSVLITGETGTGKELVARAIHRLSKRRDHPFIKLDCASIPAGLLESELFGHQRGAYTSAYTDRIGRLELADQGTIFLDEIGDLPLELQPKLLRALQDREFERLGGNKSLHVNVRLIAATNRDLKQLAEQGNFRQDLYYRLNVFPVWVPPLRKRREDIPLLVRYFIDKFARKMDKRLEHVSPRALHALLNWHWPGNVRELENVIERAVILAGTSVLELPTLNLIDEISTYDNSTVVDALRLSNCEPQREMIVRALDDSNWVVGTPNGAAAKLGLKRTTLHAKMKKLGICRIRHDDIVA